MLQWADLAHIQLNNHTIAKLEYLQGKIYDHENNEYLFCFIVCFGVLSTFYDLDLDLRLDLDLDLKFEVFKLFCLHLDIPYLDLLLSRDLDLSLDLSRDLDLSPPRDLDLERDLDLLPERLFSSVSLILRPSNSVASSLSSAYSMSDLEPNSTIPSPLLMWWVLVYVISPACLM